MPNVIIISNHVSNDQDFNVKLEVVVMVEICTALKLYNDYKELGKGCIERFF